MPYHSTVFIAVTAVVALVALVSLVKWAGKIEQTSSAASGGNMESVSVTFGDPVEQSAFAREYSAFLGEWYFLQEAIKKVMLDRTINPGIKAEAAAVVDLPDDDPRVLAVEDRYKANIASFVLARTAIDDFSELLTLASNGWGIGALKTLRGMYERVVTSAYVVLEPQVSRALVDDTWVQSWRTWKRAVALVPSLAERVDKADIEALESKATEAQARKNESVCSRCKQLIAVHPWTKMTLDAMATKVDSLLETLGKPHSRLSDLYLKCYLEPTALEHATGTSVNNKIANVDGHWTYRMESARERQQALLYGHALMLLLLARQADHFGWDVEKILQPRFTAYKVIWGMGVADEQK
jgi:hypothetical protein